MKPLSPRLTRVAYRVAKNEDSVSAFRLEGYAESYAAKGWRWLKDPRFAAIVDSVQTELRGRTMYDLEAAVAETDKWIAMIEAAENPNFMAAAKLISHKAELHGLLVQKHEIKQSVDIRDALAAARARVAAHVVNVPALPSDSPLD
jgi:hypothetical protein